MYYNNTKVTKRARSPPSSASTSSNSSSNNNTHYPTTTTTNSSSVTFIFPSGSYKRINIINKDTVLHQIVWHYGTTCFPSAYPPINLSNDGSVGHWSIPYEGVYGPNNTRISIITPTEYDELATSAANGLSPLPKNILKSFDTIREKNKLLLTKYIQKRRSQEARGNFILQQEKLQQERYPHEYAKWRNYNTHQVMRCHPPILKTWAEWFNSKEAKCRMNEQDKKEKVIDEEVSGPYLLPVQTTGGYRVITETEREMWRRMTPQERTNWKTFGAS